MVICHKNIRIFFGTKEHAIEKGKLPLLDQKSWQEVTDFVQAKKLFGVNQCHDVNGLHIEKETDQHQSILVDADFLITNQIDYGLAVTTADCIPVVLYDPVVCAVAMVHAGWKGIVAGVIPKALQKMHQLYNSNMHTVEVFIGPFARQCCYEIKTDTYEFFQKNFPSLLNIVMHRNNKMFLDLMQCVQYQLHESGILKKNINEQFACCTICNDTYCSFRRGKNEWRNINAVILHKQ